MPTPNKGPRLGGGPAHERLMLNNMATQLFMHKRIETTQTKAKRLQPVAERLITFAKRGDLAARRRVMRQVTDKDVVHELFTEIAPLMELREGGYTRVIKTTFRKGDNAPMAIIELVLEPVNPKPKKTSPATDEVADEATSEVAEEETAQEEITQEETPEEETPEVEVTEEEVAESKETE